MSDLNTPTQAAAAATETPAAATGLTAAVETPSADSGTLLTDDSDPNQGGTDSQTAKGVDDGANTEGAPEAYADFEFPEGVEVDADAVGEFKTMAKSLNLTQEAAQQVATLGASLVQKTLANVIAQADTIAKDWAGSVRNDPEIGGANYQTSLASARSALQTFGSDAFRKFLDDTKVGNHPEMIRFMAKVGKTTANDTVVAGDPKPSRNDGLARLFPKSLKEA